MLISYSWLKDYVDIDLGPAELADRLTLLGLEVDDVDEVDLTLDGVVVGRVLDVQKHPNADRLTVCSVDVGLGEPSQIICGAPNVAAAQLVPVALPGTTLNLPSRDNPDERQPVEIRKSKIRGEVSLGMICAADELGVSDDHSGIMVLEEGALPGQRFSDYLVSKGVVVQDAVFDIELTPNRPDATSHLGVARDVAALLEKPLRYPTISDVPSQAGEKVSIRIENPDGCARYAGVLVEGVTVAESPDWMKRRLESIGLRPRNNLVDITNYVMFELGQPLHAFDFDEVAGGSIVVKDAVDGQPFTTLDDVDRKLDSDMLMICDGARAVAVAGVMGGQNSEVTDATTNVLIESAWFDPASVRRTARALSLQTDASYRFERGIDPLGSLRAAQRAADLMVELAGGTITEVVDENPRPYQARVVDLRPKRVEVILGVAIPDEQIRSYLERLEFAVESVDGRLRCTVPSFRPDVEREIDLIEEVARLHGFDNIPAPKGNHMPYAPAQSTRAERLRSDAMTFLSGLGFREVFTNSLLPPPITEHVANLLDPAGKPVNTFNAINHHMSALRPSLLPGVLRVAAHNRNHGQTVIRLAEFGHVFHKLDSDDDPRSSWIGGYMEREALILAIAGPSISGSWDREESLSDFFDLKGMFRSLLSFLDVRNVEVVTSDESHGVLRNGIDILMGGERIGVAGQLNPLASRAYDLDSDLFFLEVFWKPIAEAAQMGVPKQYRAVSRHPTVVRDLSVVIGPTVRVGDLVDTIRVAAGSDLIDVGVFDVYDGEGIDDGNRSVGFKLEFGADRTLVDEEVDSAIESVVEVLSTDWKARLRS